MTDRKVFDRPRYPAIEFEVGGDPNPDLFLAAGTAPGRALLAVSKGIEDPNIYVKVEAMIAFLDLVLLPESAERYAERFRSTTNPIGLEEAAAHCAWLIEVYSDRPTEPPSSSVNGSADSGTDSTAGQPATESTPATSQRIGS